VLPVLNPIAFNIVVATGSWIVALGVLLALGGGISVPVFVVGVVPFFVYRTDEPAVASDITTGFLLLVLAV
jgi:hypothetical protein